MKIASAEIRVEQFPLVRPYTITFRTITAVENVIVILRDDAGHVGLGAASPEPHVTGETSDHCRAALAPGSLDFLVGANVHALPVLLAALERQMPTTPAARAAVDIALHDLQARALGVSLCDLWGRAHDALATSITIGIKSADETLVEADEYVARGFRILKVKIGRALEEDIERLVRLRAHVGAGVLIRVDANQGYTTAETRQFFDATAALDLEFMEQPVKASAIDELRVLPEAQRSRIAADESLIVPADALRLATPPHLAGIFNIKLMKCGGLRPARAIATIAQVAGISLMWGCMDESRISIAAALHAAFSSPATRYIDLDGSFDLARDIARDGSGFVVTDGVMRTAQGPGTGVLLRD